MPERNTLQSAVMTPTSFSCLCCSPYFICSYFPCCRLAQGRSGPMVDGKRKKKRRSRIQQQGKGDARGELSSLVRRAEGSGGGDGHHFSEIICAHGHFAAHCRREESPVYSTYICTSFSYVYRMDGAQYTPNSSLWRRLRCKRTHRVLSYWFSSWVMPHPELGGSAIDVTFTRQFAMVNVPKYRRSLDGWVKQQTPLFGAFYCAHKIIWSIVPGCLR